jgi:hypothetical protein
MTIAFYDHPFSSYVQKAKTALYEKGIPFESKMIDGFEPFASEFAAGRTSASPTARRRRRCSMLTGLTGSPSALLPSKPIAGSSSLARATPARWTMRVPTGSFFRSAHPSIGTERNAKTSLL